MTPDPYPWRESKPLPELLAAVRPVFMSLGVVAPTGGCTKSELVAAEQRMMRPLPADVRAFYSAMRPTELFASDHDKEFGFYTIESKELSWRSMEGAEPADEWIGASGLSLGQSTYGDPFWWVEGHRSLPAGSIVLLDHEGGLGGDVMFVYFARTFREFLAKAAHFKSLYAATQNELFKREYLELNPSAKL